MANERVSAPSRLFSDSPSFIKADFAATSIVSMRRKKWGVFPCSFGLTCSVRAGKPRSRSAAARHLVHAAAPSWRKLIAGFGARR